MECGESTTFSGFHLACTEEGVKVTLDPKETEVICAISAPKNRKELLSFLGAASQLAKWTPRYSFHRKGLSHHTEKETAWFWGEEEEQAFREFRDHLADPSKLSDFNENLETVLILDGSNLFGLGYALT